MSDPLGLMEIGPGPLVALAIHDGHELRPELAPYSALSPEERLREEDPYTGEWTRLAPTRLVPIRSRFEADLNRPRDRAVYLSPGDAWGLRVWKEELPESVIAASLAYYDAFYERLGAVLDRKIREEGFFVVYDLHSYNHRRAGPDAPPAEAQANPDLNLGTGSQDRTFWGPALDAFLKIASGGEEQAGELSVGENVKFFGGHLGRWIRDTYQGRGCALSIELKKIFMDEWTGELFPEEHERIYRILQASAEPVERAARSVIQGV